MCSSPQLSQQVSPDQSVDGATDPSTAPQEATAKGMCAEAHKAASPALEQHDMQIPIIDRSCEDEDCEMSDVHVDHLYSPVTGGGGWVRPQFTMDAQTDNDPEVLTLQKKCVHCIPLKCTVHSSCFWVKA